MQNDVALRLRSHLDGLGIPFREVTHEPTTTSEASAKARGEPLAVGGKAILLKTDGLYHLFVLSAARLIDANAIRRHLHVKKLRFATSAELLTLTGLVPGSLPPFGVPILPFDLFADTSVLANDRIAFNAASLEASFILAREDYLRAAAPTVFAFAEPSVV